MTIDKKNVENSYKVITQRQHIHLKLFQFSEIVFPTLAEVFCTHICDLFFPVHC